MNGIRGPKRLKRAFTDMAGSEYCVYIYQTIAINDPQMYNV